MRTPYKMKGYSYPGTSPAKHTEDPHTPHPKGYNKVKDASNSLTKTGQGTDETAKHAKSGSKSTRDHIADGGKVFLMPDGSHSLQSDIK